MLGYARIITIVMICMVYINHVSRETVGLQIFVGSACFIYVINHVLLIQPHEGKRREFYVFLTNGVVTALLGVLFPETCLYVIIFGIDALYYLFAPKP